MATSIALLDACSCVNGHPFGRVIFAMSIAVWHRGVPLARTVGMAAKAHTGFINVAVRAVSPRHLTLPLVPTGELAKTLLATPLHYPYRKQHGELSAVLLAEMTLTHRRARLHATKRLGGIF